MHLHTTRFVTIYLVGNTYCDKIIRKDSSFGTKLTFPPATICFVNIQDYIPLPYSELIVSLGIIVKKNQYFC